jgi:serine/threonine protein kinase
LVVYQILCALAYTHSQNILHRDLKPENILINASCSVKLCDFGLARGVDFDNDPTMSTNYVQTRWYRAPELLLNSKEVSAETDIWSIGCIFGELLGGVTMFRGSSPIDQIGKILTVLGTPKYEDIRGSQQGVDFMKRLKKYEGVDLAAKYPFASPTAIDLLKSMLCFNHEKRVSAKEALKHPYFKEIYDPAHLIEGPKFDFSFEQRISDSASIKRECYQTLVQFRATTSPSSAQGGIEPAPLYVNKSQKSNTISGRLWNGVVGFFSAIM